MGGNPKKILKGAISSLLATAIDLFVLLVLVEFFDFSVIPAVFIGTCTGGVTSFWANKYWTFKQPSASSVVQILLFVVVALCTAWGVSIVVDYLVGHFQVGYVLAKAMASLLLFVVWTYPLQSKLVFRRQRTG